MPYRDADQLNTYLFHEGTAISAYEFMGATQPPATEYQAICSAYGRRGPWPSP